MQVPHSQQSARTPESASSLTRDRPGHRRFSLRIALKNSPLTLAQIAQSVPVYQFLARSVSSETLYETIRNDINVLRASGNNITARGYDSRSTAYYLSDEGNIHIDIRGLNVSLLLPLLEFKESSAAEAFAHMGISKAISQGQASKIRTPMAFSVPRGRFVTTVASAIQSSRPISFIYRSLHDSEPSARRILPITLEIHRGYFYVRGFKLTQKTDSSVLKSFSPANTGHQSASVADIHLYKIDRMQKCTIKEEKIDLSPSDCERIISQQAEADSWFTPINVFFWAAPGTCLPLTNRSVHISKENVEQSKLADLCTPAEYGDIYFLEGISLDSLLEEVAFYGDQLQVLSPKPVVDEVVAHIQAAYNALKRSLDTSFHADDALSQPHMISSRPRTISSTSNNKSSPHAEADANFTYHNRTAHSSFSIDTSVSRRESYYSYLLNHGSATLGDLAAKFSVDMLTVRRELQDLFTTEIFIDGTPYSPYDLSMPEWEEGEPLNKNWVIEAVENPLSYASHHSDLTFTLAEVISVLAAIDSLLTVAAGEHRRSLLELRSRFTDAASSAGYERALWPPSDTKFTPHVITAVSQAIEERRELSIDYWALDSSGHAVCQKARLKPFTIDPQSNPLLAAVNADNELRTYRLDRISEAKILDATFPKTPIYEWQRTYRNRSRTMCGTSATLLCEPHARWIAEELPGVKMSADGKLRFSAANIHWIRTVLVRLGKSALLFTSPDIAKDLVPDLHALCKRYSISLHSARKAGDTREKLLERSTCAAVPTKKGYGYQWFLAKD